MIGYKVLTRLYGSPIQGGPPLFDGRTPFVTPQVECDTGPEECGKGWNFCRDPQTALRIGGCWPDGKTSTLWVVEAADTAVVQRRDKCRAPAITILRPTTHAENRAAVLAFCAVFGNHAQAMATAMDSWARLLAAQPGVGYPAARAARAAWDAWDAWAARDARDARDAWDARAARAARAARDAWDASAARAALTVRYARLMGWVPGEDRKSVV